MKERESLFADYVAELRKLEREASQKKKEFVDEKVMCYFWCPGGTLPSENIEAFDHQVCIYLRLHLFRIYKVV